MTISLCRFTRLLTLATLAAARPLAGQLPPRSSAAGTYATAVELMESSCPDATVRPMPTTVAHRAGDSMLTVQHAGLEYEGTVSPDGSFTMRPRTVEAGGTAYTIIVRGAFRAPGRFDARVRIDVRGPGSTQCGYTVRWSATLNPDGSGAGTLRAPDGALMRFEWTAADGAESGRGRQAAHGFALRADSLATPVAITAHHVVERSSGQTGLAIARQLRTASLVSRDGPERATPLGAMIPLAGARTIGGGTWDRDVAFFRITHPDRVPALTLAAMQAAEGDTLWLLAETSAPGERLHPAVVVISGDSALAYRYVRPLDTALTSGAAVLDRDGQVAGLNVGTVVMTAERWASFRSRFEGCCRGEGEGGVVGIAVGSRALRRHLAAAGR